MANFIYDLAREAFLGGDLDWDANNIKIVLCTSGYTPNSATDQFLSTISGGNRVATSGNLASKTKTLGVADAADVTWSAVTGSQVTQAVIYADSGVEGSSRLIANINVATNLPVTPNGGDISCVFDSGSNKIFKL